MWICHICKFVTFFVLHTCLLLLPYTRLLASIGKYKWKFGKHVVENLGGFMSLQSKETRSKNENAKNVELDNVQSRIW